MNFLSRIQRKSSAVKMQYSFVIAGLATGIIGLVWMSTLPARFDKFLTSNPVADENSIGFTELLSDTKSQVGNIIDATKEGIANDVPNTESLNALGSPETDRGNGTESPESIDTVTPAVFSAPETIQEPVATTTTTELFVPSAPKMILIGTSTSKQSSSTL